MAQEDGIRDDSAYFKRMLDLIPPQSYFDAATKEQLIAQNYGTKGEYCARDQIKIFNHLLKIACDNFSNLLKMIINLLRHSIYR